MSECLVNPANRQYRRRCQIVISISLVCYIAFSQLSQRLGHGTAGLVAAGLGGAAFFAELVALSFLVFRLRDEFQRILLTQSFLWATVITMGIAMIWGFIELHARDEFPHMPVLMIPAILIVLTTAAKLIIFRQHKSPQE